METFTASNGMQLKSNEGGWLERCNLNGTGIWGEVGGVNTEAPGHVWDALREFFLHERDQELGRWRYPDNPNWVVYLAPECSDYDLVVVCETSGESARYRRAEDDGGYPATCNIFARAARAYFAAHPLPKPWHDAKPGEVWALTYEGVEQAWGAGFDGSPELRFIFACGDSHVSADDADITAGRRIWPEAVSDA